MAAIAVKSFIRKARQIAASHWYVIDQWDEHREIGHGDNLFVIQHKYKDLIRGIYHIVAASGKNATISVDIFFWHF